MINVILSTYNEADIIIPMLKMLSDVLNGMSVPYLIIIVDGKSTDNTVENIKSLNLAFLKIIVEKCKSGLGNAYIEGLKYCRYDYTFILDADLQHDPNFIPKFFKLIRSEKNYDIVTGTRYSGFGMVSKWSFSRRFMSRLSNNLAKYVIGLRTTDLTGSYRCYKTEILRKLLLQTSCKGFGVQMELISRAEKMGMRIAEVPIIFYNRTAGQSKYSFDEFYLFVKTVFKLYLSI